jgi:phage shock protein A
MFQALIDKGVLSQEDPGVAEFTEIRDRIERTRKNNELYKETRKNSPYEDYATKEQEDQKLNDQLAGGLNVITGRGR